MQADVTFMITGLDALLAKLETINDDMKKKGGRVALRRAANVIAARVKENAQRIDDPDTREAIFKNAGVRWSSRLHKRTGDLGFRVGIIGGAKQYADTRENRKSGRVGQTYYHAGDKDRPGGDTWYWRLVEFGTERMEARPFMRPALEQNTTEVSDTFVREYDKAIDRAIKRAAKGK